MELHYIITDYSAAALIQLNAPAVGLCGHQPRLREGRPDSGDLDRMSELSPFELKDTISSSPVTRIDWC
jgi:hypothetical protein